MSGERQGSGRDREDAQRREEPRGAQQRQEEPRDARERRDEPEDAQGADDILRIWETQFAGWNNAQVTLRGMRDDLDALERLMASQPLATAEEVKAGAAEVRAIAKRLVDGTHEGLQKVMALADASSNLVFTRSMSPADFEKFRIHIRFSLRGMR